MDAVFADFDADGVVECAIADQKRKQQVDIILQYFSVDDIPDTGDGSETWTLETNGHDFTLSACPENKWDVLTIGNNLYFFMKLKIQQLCWDGAAWQLHSISSTSWRWLNTFDRKAVDLDNDGTLEGVASNL